MAVGLKPIGAGIVTPRRTERAPVFSGIRRASGGERWPSRVAKLPVPPWRVLAADPLRPLAGALPSSASKTPPSTASTTSGWSSPASASRMAVSTWSIRTILSLHTAPPRLLIRGAAVEYPRLLFPCARLMTQNAPTAAHARPGGPPTSARRRRHSARCFWCVDCGDHCVLLVVTTERTA